MLGNLLLAILDIIVFSFFYFSIIHCIFILLDKEIRIGNFVLFGDNNYEE